MTKLEAQPFIDESGNLVIPPVMLGQKKERKVLVLETPTGVVRIILKGRRVERVVDNRKAKALGVVIAPPMVVEIPIDSTGNEMLKLAESSMGFWDNPVDDEVWNNA